MENTQQTIKSLFGSTETKSKKAYIIAEIGINHEGSAETCADMIKAFAKAGADAVKLQTVDADRSYSPETDSYKIFKEAALTQAETANMFELATQHGVESFTTSGDLFTLDWVNKLNPAAHKISSGLLSCIPIVRATCQMGKPVLMSTGMSDDLAIDSAVKIAINEGCAIGLFQCTSEYPCPPEQLNLAAIGMLEKKYNRPVGFSDHSLGTSMAPLSIAAGARMIEKHVTLDKTRQGFDHSISLTPNEFANMVKAIRLAETALGHSRKSKSQNIQQKASNLSAESPQLMTWLLGTYFHYRIYCSCGFQVTMMVWPLGEPMR